MKRVQRWRLCVLISEELCPSGDWWRVAASVIEAAERAHQPICIQLREKTLESNVLLDRTRRLIERCRPYGVGVVVNDRPDVAWLAGADAVHLGQDDLPCAEVKKLVRDQLLIGVSTTNLDQAKQAVGDGADYCGVGPMFASPTKPGKPVAGAGYLRRFLAAFPWMPHLAIGGITPDNINELVDAGVGGVAVSSSVCTAANPGQQIDRLLRAFEVKNKDSFV